MPINENAPLVVVPGAIRFNTDSMKLEYYRGGPVGFGTTTTTGEWVNLTTDSPDIQTGGARGVFGGGEAPGSQVNTIDYVTISTTGNAIDFGDLLNLFEAGGACSSSSRGVWGGFSVPAQTNTLQYITISSTGNAADFGDLTRTTGNLGACSSATRGLFIGGAGNSNILDYITIASTGDARDFGDLTVGREYAPGCSSSTRSVFAGGFVGPATRL